MKTSEASPDERKARLRPQFLKKLQDEQMAGAIADQPSGRDEKRQLARRREGPAREGPLSPFLEKQRAVQSRGTVRVSRTEELTAAGLRNHEAKLAEDRAAKALEERRSAQPSAAAPAGKVVESKPGAISNREERLEETRRVEALEAAEAQRALKLKAASLQKQEAERRAEVRAAKVREQPQNQQRSRNSQARREPETRPATLPKIEEERQAELRAARLQERQRLAQQFEAAQAKRAEDLKAAALLKQEEERETEARVAKLREQQRNALQSEAQLRRDEEWQASTSRHAKQEQRLAGREQAAAELQAAEDQRREQQQEEALRIHAEARRAAAQIALPGKQEPESAAGTSVGQAHRAAARARVRTALKTLSPPRRRATLAATSQTSPPPSPTQVFYLSASTSLLVDENNDPVYLRGVTVRGLDTVAPASGQTFPAALALDDNSLLELCNRWGANLVRLPFQAATILSGNGAVSVADMLAGLDATVAAITEAGAYVLLALEPPVGGATPPAPDASTTQAWQTLATRYQTEPRVLYEIFASPSPLAANWPQSAAGLVATIRQHNPTSLIFVGSGLGASEVAGLPLLSPSGGPFSNIVYTIAVSATSTPNPDDGQFQALVESYPVFASMWSDDGSDFGRMASRVADLFGRFGIGWAAANWNADPLLVTNAPGDDFTPTSWGQIAQRALAVAAVSDFQPASPISQTIYATRGPALHTLRTKGSFIVDENDAPVNLRGVTVQGLDTVAPASAQTFPAALALDDSNLLEMCGRWGVNLVRLPFQAQTVLSGNGSLTVAAILAGLDATIAVTTQAGAYVLLALQPAPGAGTPVTPPAQAAQVWQVLAERYQKTASVFFELFSTPLPLAGNWPQIAAALVTTIRQRKPSSLIFVGSGNGAYDVTGLPFVSATGGPVLNLIYTIAVSPEKMPSPDDGALQALAESNPVFASLWSDDGSDFGRSSARVSDLFDRYGIGWAASNWNADPRLVADAANYDFTATGWGLNVGRAINLPGKALLKPFHTDTSK